MIYSVYNKIIHVCPRLITCGREVDGGDLGLYSDAFPTPFLFDTPSKFSFLVYSYFNLLGVHWSLGVHRQ